MKDNENEKRGNFTCDRDKHEKDSNKTTFVFYFYTFVLGEI